MRYTIVAIILISLASANGATSVLYEILWDTVQAQGKLKVGQVIEPQDSATIFAQLKIENIEAGLRTFSLLTIDDPSITTARYALMGKVRYENVHGKAYLEMWNYFTDGNKYFSRTLDNSGPTQNLQGSSDWRSFILPFNITKTDARPVKLELNLVLPGRGVVFLGPMKLVQYNSQKEMIAMLRQDQYSSSSTTKAWWTDRDAGIFGGITGSVIGILGGLIGTLTGLGKAKKLALSLTVGLIALGVASLVIGILAVILSQPYAVYYPLLLIGVICTILLGTGYRSIRRRYEYRELRKMKALDIS